jgi:hypothetical protein
MLSCRMILNLREAYYRPFRAADSEWGSSYWRAADQELGRINNDARVDVASSVGPRSESDREAAGGDFEMTRKAEREREDVFPIF